MSKLDERIPSTTVASYLIWVRRRIRASSAGLVFSVPFRASIRVVRECGTMSQSRPRITWIFVWRWSSLLHRVRLMRLLFFGLMSGLLVSCTHPADVVRREASEDFGCPRSEIRTSSRGGGQAWVAKGCRRQGVYQCRRGSTQCSNLLLMARERASREHSCDFWDVRVREISPFIFSTEGCGIRANYHCEMIGGVARCMLEADESRAPTH
jgi:hypothetical protein